MYGVVKLRVRGISPVLMHNPVGLMQPAGSGLGARGGKKIPTPVEEARLGLYALPSGQLFIPSDAFREACLIAAGDVRDPTRKGRATMTRRFGASVFLSSEHFPLYRAGSNGDLGEPITANDDDWETYVKRVVVMGNGIMRGRAQVREWACDVEFEIDEDTISATDVAAILGQAGKYPGVLDYRPGKKGPFGRFEVEAVL